MPQSEGQPKTSNVKIMEALELLNEAAKEKKDELMGLFTNKYSHIKQAVVDGAEQGKEMFDNAKNATEDAIGNGEETIKKFISETEVKVRKDPWSYIAGVAAFSMLLGCLMGSRRK